MTAKGKYAEGKVKACLELRKQAVAAFTYNRIADAHSARGAMSNPQPGDFQWFERTGEFWQESAVAGKVATNTVRPITRNGLMEVKEVEHEFRLPYKNFAIDQVGRMVIRQMAGSECIVLICHRNPAVRGSWWRNVPLDFLRERDPRTPSGSWDLSQFPATDNLEDIINAYFAA